jgi:hypothetical protein
VLPCVGFDHFMVEHDRPALAPAEQVRMGLDQLLIGGQRLALMLGEFGH